MGNNYVQAFDSKWIQGLSSEREPLLGTYDIQSLADLNNSFSVVQDMRIVLIDKKLLFGLAISAVLPMVMPILIATPIDELIRAVLKVLV